MNYLSDMHACQACAGLNGMQLGDKKLVVQRASVGKNPVSVCFARYYTNIVAVALTYCICKLKISTFCHSISAYQCGSVVQR